MCECVCVGVCVCVCVCAFESVCDSVSTVGTSKLPKGF